MWIFRTHKIGTPRTKCFRKVRNKYMEEIEKGLLPTHQEIELWIDRKMERSIDAMFSLDVPQHVIEASVVEDSMNSYYEEMKKGEAVKCIGVRTRKRIRCIICLQCKFTKIKLQCGHIFHRKCIDEWASWKKECPVCKVALDLCPTEGT